MSTAPVPAPKSAPRANVQATEHEELSGNRHGIVTRLLEGTPSWLASLLIHMLALIVAALIFGGKIIVERIIDTGPIFTSVPREQLEDTEVKRVELTKLQQEQPRELDPVTQPELDSAQFGMTEGTVDEEFGHDPEGGGFQKVPDFGNGNTGFIKIDGPGPANPGAVGVPGGGESNSIGHGGNALKDRGDPNARMRPGNTKANDLAVIAALSWFARHQLPDGRWALAHRGRCQDATCTGDGSQKSDCAATALALLPYLAAGVTHKSSPLDLQGKPSYQRNVYAGVKFLLSNQKPNGDYSGENYMYAHGLATIAMSEAYGMSHDSHLRDSVLAAVRYIEAGQDPDTGGWWYQHMQRGGDTSVAGWQVMALKSAHMAGVQVKPGTLQGSEKWLTLVGKGQYKGQFSYRPDSAASPNMTAVGLLCTQYLGAPRGDPRLQEGTRLLMQQLPNAQNTNFYYWYYGSQVMHNMQGPDWDTWNRAMRHVLVDLQDKKGCAAGSWDPAKEPFGKQGGRLFTTSLATLTLEVYYRYLPLYKLGEKDELGKLPGK